MLFLDMKNPEIHFFGFLGKASDELIKEKGYRGQIASDILEKIPYVISGYEKS